MFEFTPESPKKSGFDLYDVPYYEDSSDKKVAGHSTTKSIGTLKSEVVELLSRLGADSSIFVLGKYQVGKYSRWGYKIDFNLEGLPGQLLVAALPLKNETDVRRDKALRQALFLIRDMLASEYHSSMYRPGVIPLVPYLLVEKDKTAMQMFIETSNIPLLASGEFVDEDGSQIIDGEIEEDD